MKLEKAENVCFNSVHQMSLPGCPQINKFEQVSSNGHQVSLAGEAGPLSGDQGLMSWVRLGVPGRMCTEPCTMRPLYNEAQSQMETPPVSKQTQVKTLS